MLCVRLLLNISRSDVASEKRRKEQVQNQVRAHFKKNRVNENAQASLHERIDAASL